MGIHKFAAVCGDAFLDGAKRARYRTMFKVELEKGAEQICYHVYGKLSKGRTADCLFVWKVPTVHGTQHIGNVLLAINTCREMAPKQMSHEAISHFNLIMNAISDVPKDVRNALRNYLFLGEQIKI